MSYRDLQELAREYLAKAFKGETTDVHTVQAAVSILVSTPTNPTQ